MVDVPTIEPTITLGALGIMVTIAGSIGTAMWFVIKSTATIQKIFASIEKQLALLKQDSQNQERRLGVIEDELRKQTDILTEQRVLTEKMSIIERRLDRFDEWRDHLLDEIGRSRVGSEIAHKIG
jgi:hypothetical protein